MKQDSIFSTYNNIEDTISKQASNQPAKQQPKETSDDTGEKQTIKCFVILGDPTKSGDTTYKKVIDGETKYSGMMWDVVEEIKKQPEMQKYNFEYTFSEEGFSNYTDTVKWINKGKYDLGIASYARTAERDLLAGYSTPIMLDADAVFHIVKVNKMDMFKDMAYDISKLIVLLLILGIITGIFLFIFDKKRNKMLERKNSKKQFFLRSVMTGIATFFGEAGFLFENSTPTIKGIILVTLAMSTATIFLSYMQGEITSDLIEKKLGGELNEGDLPSKPIIGHEGYAVTGKLENMGANMEVYEGKTNNDLMKIYLKNPNKYNGVGLTYCDGFPLQKSSKIMASIFANKPMSMVYTKDKPQFAQDFDVSILKLRGEGIIKRICRNYYGNIKNIPVCSL